MVSNRSAASNVVMLHPVDSLEHEGLRVFHPVFGLRIFRMLRNLFRKLLNPLLHCGPFPALEVHQPLLVFSTDV